MTPDMSRSAHPASALAAFLTFAMSRNRSCELVIFLELSLEFMMLELPRGGAIWTWWKGTSRTGQNYILVRYSFVTCSEKRPVEDISKTKSITLDTKLTFTKT